MFVYQRVPNHVKCLPAENVTLPSFGHQNLLFHLWSSTHDTSDSFQLKCLAIEELGFLRKFTDSHFAAGQHISSDIRRIVQRLTTQFPDPLGCKTARHLPRWRWYLIARVLDRLAQRDAPRALWLISMLSNSAANGSENKAIHTECKAS